MTEVRKIGAVIPVSRQVLLDHGLVEPTAEEQREFDASRADHEMRKRSATAAWPVFVSQLAAVTDPVARVVLVLHGAGERGKCEGCDFDGYEAEPPRWPCSTTLAVAAAVGIEVPRDLDMVEWTEI